MGAFFHAVGVFFGHLGAVQWDMLGIALGLHVAKLLFRAVAWQSILAAAYPANPPRLRSAFGAYVAGVGINSVAPARGGDLVKLYLIKHRIPDSSYATLTPTLVAETLLDFLVAGGLTIWAFSIGVLPTHQVYSRLPSVEWRYFLRNWHTTSIVLVVALALAVIAFVIFLEKGDAFRARVGQGFAILRKPRRLALGVFLPQAISWVFRIAGLYYFLRAFGVHASVHNALLVQVVDSLATLFPATPGGAGTKQGLILYVFKGEAVSDSLLLAFSVGMNIALVACNLVLGLVALALMARTISWKRLRVESAQERSADTPG